jgi:hypothetical protein
MNGDLKALNRNVNLDGSGERKGSSRGYLASEAGHYLTLPVPNTASLRYDHAITFTLKPIDPYGKASNPAYSILICRSFDATVFNCQPLSYQQSVEWGTCTTDLVSGFTRAHRDKRMLGNTSVGCIHRTQPDTACNARFPVLESCA